MNEIGKIARTAVVKLGRAPDGSQIVVLPEGFELDTAEVDIAADGDKLTISPHREEKTAPASWAEFLDNLEPVEVEWPDIDEGLPPAEDVDLLR